jgi:hypothetical protein
MASLSEPGHSRDSMLYWSCSGSIAGGEAGEEGRGSRSMFDFYIDTDASANI